jgi:hypothetical protein
MSPSGARSSGARSSGARSSGARSSGARSSGARSAGLLSGQLGGQLLASGVPPADRIGITVEPAGGKPGPTTTPVAVLPA